jgi:hypothetical protein
MLTSNLNKLMGLSRKERRLLFGSVLLLPVVQAALLVMRYSRLRRMIEKLTPLKPGAMPVPEAGHIQRGREISRIVTIAAKHGPYRATCLRRSVLVWWFLRREGIPGKVCFGARLSDSRLEAHAWVEYNGIIINDSPDIRARYRPLYGALPPNEPGL